MSDISLGLICTIIGTAIGVFGAFNYVKKDAAHSGRIESKLDYTARGIDEIRIDNKEQGRQLNNIVVRLSVVEGSCKSAHKRIDKLEGVNNDERTSN